MSDVEDRLRGLLRDRAATPRDNPARRAEVRSRITGMRRRRVAGAALGLILVTVAGLLALARLPGRNESLPAGVPKPSYVTAIAQPPYFTANGKPMVRGYWGLVDQTDSDSGHGMTLLGTGRNQYRRYLVVAWCSQPGRLHLSTPAVDVGGVPCRTGVGDHFEGALDVPAADAERLFVTGRGGDFTSSVRPEGVGGRWRLAVLQRDLPDRLPQSDTLPVLLEGSRNPNGGTFRLTVPAGSTFRIGVECVEGVVLTFRAPAGELAVARCELGAPVSIVGAVAVTRETLTRLGLRPGQTVLVTVRRSGRDTDQWRVWRPQQ